MLTGMLPQLTVVAQAEEQGRKIDLTESSVSHHGTTADNTRPKRWVVDGDRTQANYFVTGNDQTQTANTENPANPGYWLQLDLGQKYSITKLNLCIYYDGRFLKDLVVLASNEAEFTKENSQVVYNADSNNFFGLGAGTDSEMPAQNNSAGFDITPTPVVEAQYPKGGNTQRTYLLFATSADGETWTSYPKPLISPTDGGWYNNFVYRSTFTYENGKLRVWFSGGESQGWRIGYTEFDSFKTTVLPTLGTAYTPDAPTPPQPGDWLDVTPGSGDILFDPYTAANDGWKVENDTDAASYRKGSKATFCFYGTAVQWIGQQEDCFGPAVLYLDGNPVAEGDIKNQHIPSGNNHDVILFTAESLENKAHVLTIEPKNDGLRTPTGGGPRPHDGVQITKLQYKGPEKGQAPDGLYSVEIDQTDIPVGGTARITALAPFNSASSVSYESADKNEHRHGQRRRRCHRRGSGADDNHREARK